MYKDGARVISAKYYVVYAPVLFMLVLFLSTDMSVHLAAFTGLEK